MNLMNGTLRDGVFEGENVRIEGLEGPDAKLTLGFRAEDAAVAPGEAGQITAPIYTIELLGDATMLTVRAGGNMISVKADKTLRAEIGDEVSFRVTPEICHLFEDGDGARIA